MTTVKAAVICSRLRLAVIQHDRIVSAKTESFGGKGLPWEGRPDGFQTVLLPILYTAPQHICPNFVYKRHHHDDSV